MPEFEISKNQNDKFSHLDRDILFSVILFLNFEELFKLKFVSKSLHLKLNLILINYDFWFNMLNDTEMSKKLSKDYQKEKDTCSPHILFAASRDTFEKSLPQLPHQYLSKSSTLFLFFGGKEYTNVNQTISFNLNEIIPPLLIDDANCVFEKVSRFKNLLTLIQANVFDLKAIYNAFVLDDAEMSDGTGISFIDDKFFQQIKVSDLAFVALLPTTIRLNAFKCFDTFVRTYLAITFMSAGTETNDVKDYHINTVAKLILSAQTNHTSADYFFKHFIKLTLNLIPLNQLKETKKKFIFQFLQFVFENNFGKAVIENLSKMSPEKSETFMNALYKSDHAILLTTYAQVFNQLDEIRIFKREKENEEIETECRTYLCNSFQSNMNFIKNVDVNKLTPKQLKLIQEKINEEINNAIELLNTKKDPYEIEVSSQMRCRLG